jgi:hypothetical protein
MASVSSMHAEQLELRLAGLLHVALGQRGPGLNTAARVIADVLVDTACCRPGVSGATIVEQTIARMRLRLAAHSLSSST